MTKQKLIVVFLWGAAMMVGSCETQNAEFRSQLWCGDALCEWEVYRGEVQKIATWDEREKALRLVGDDVMLTRVLSEYETFDSEPGCFELELIADHDDVDDVCVHAIIEMETWDGRMWRVEVQGLVNGPGGTITFAQGNGPFEPQLPACGTPAVFPELITEDYDNWQPSDNPIRVNPSLWHNRIRVSILKKGIGRFDVRKLDVKYLPVEECVAVSPVSLGQPNGSACSSPHQCPDRICAFVPITAFLDDDLFCSECEIHDDCPDGGVCGIELDTEVGPYPGQGLYRGCGEPSRHTLGERCVSNAECDTGICRGSLCAECTYENGCADGRECKGRNELSMGEVFFPDPYQCGPGARGGMPNAPCLWDDDCVSGHCAFDELLKICIDGRRCNTIDDCSLPENQDEPGAQCKTIGAYSGKCD